jgi:hypothetical protein
MSAVCKPATPTPFDVLSTLPEGASGEMLAGRLYSRQRPRARNGLTGWRRERTPALPDDHRFGVVPDWVCEVFSSAGARRDQALKLPLDPRDGVVHARPVAPDLRVLEVHESPQGRWMPPATLTDDAKLRLPPFDTVGFLSADPWG